MGTIPATNRMPRPCVMERPLDTSVHDMVRAGFPGAIGYSRTGDTRRYAAAGYADVVRGARADPRMRFRIASNTKAFTAAMVLQLVGEQRLSLDAPVSRWLPGIPGEITVRQLLDHTSGLYDPTNEPEFWQPYLNGNPGSCTGPRTSWRPRSRTRSGNRTTPTRTTSCSAS